MTTDKSDAFWMEQALRMADRGRFGAAPSKGGLHPGM